LAAAALAVGVLVYLADRSPGSVYFLPAAYSLADGQSLWFGRLGGYLPDFLHVYALSLLTAAVLGATPRAALASARCWWAIDTLFELGQHPLVSPQIAAAVPAEFGGIPFLENAAPYFASGTFDPWDVGAIALGALAAYWTLARIGRENRRHVRSSEPQPVKFRLPLLIGMIVLGLLAALGCGGPPAAPAAPNPHLSYGIKQLHFSWPVVPGADFYRLLESPDGVSGFTQVGSDTTATTVTHDIALYRRLNARYMVAACGIGPSYQTECTNSAPLSLAANLLPAIGYVKASNTAAGDEFGLALALSADGSTLAVGAHREDSNATGIGGDSADNSATDSGAVYVFTRASGVWSQQAYVKASNTAAGDEFGLALALSADGSTLAVGAHREDSNATGIGGDQAEDSAVDAGAVYLY
jgi:hypothetical protein